MGFLPKVTNQLPTSLQGYIPVIRAVMRLSEKVYHAYSPYFAQELWNIGTILSILVFNFVFCNNMWMWSLTIWKENARMFVKWLLSSAWTHEVTTWLSVGCKPAKIGPFYNQQLSQKLDYFLRSFSDMFCRIFFSLRLYDSHFSNIEVTWVTTKNVNPILCVKSMARELLVCQFYRFHLLDYSKISKLWTKKHLGKKLEQKLKHLEQVVSEALAHSSLQVFCPCPISGVKALNKTSF